jgi:hypothetical protein
MTSVPCNPIFDGWRLTISWWHCILYCVLSVIVLRILHSLLRARAVQKGDFPHERARKQTVIDSYWKAFWCCFRGYNDFKEHSDLWIPAGIGVIELAAYPVLLVLGQILMIGGWVGIKTAGAWMGWQASRTSFNRFLLFNLLNLLLSYLWLSHYIKRLPCTLP